MPSDDFFKRLRNRKPKPAEPQGEGTPAGENRQQPDGEITLTAKQRQRQLAESFLGNEALTEGLDEPAAKALIEWSMDLSRRVVESARDLPAEQVDKHVERRGEAAHHLVEAVRDLALQQPPAKDLPPAAPAAEHEETVETKGASPGAEPQQDLGKSDLHQQELLQQIARQAQDVYGGETTDERVLPPELIETIQRSGGSPEQRIAALRQTVENRARSQTKHYSHQHNEEEDRDW
jgi:hypothetical protein